jgi:hypothetical protein
MELGYFSSNLEPLHSKARQAPSLDRELHAVSVSGKRNFTAGDKGAEIAVGSARPFAETKCPRASPLIRVHSPKVGKSPFDWDCVVADAVGFEPVSTMEFPANREINREFFDFGSDCGSDVAIRPMI